MKEAYNNCLNQFEIAIKINKYINDIKLYFYINIVLCF